MFAHLLALMRMGSPIACPTRCVRCRRMITVLMVALVLASIAAPAQKATAVPSALQIANIQINVSNVGLYEKFELTFTINGTVATNPSFPYDPSPPAGVPVGVGISVEGLFSPDNWTTVITQPGFVYQGYERRCLGSDPDNGCLGGVEWLYPQGDAVWKVRFAPQRTGVWRYRVRATDASGTVQSSEGTFTVTTSNVPHNHGFIRVSPTDPGYFEYVDGTPFIGVGYNESFDGKRFTYAVDAGMRRLASGRVNFLCMWMTGSGIFMAPWNPWHSHHLPGEGGYFNPASLTYAQAYPGHLVSLRLWDYPDPSMENRRNPCMFQGFTSNVSVKPNTTYQLSIRARTIGVIGPRNRTFPDYGLTVRKAGWLGDTCADPAATSSASTRLAGYANGTTDGWKTFTSTFTTGANEFFLGNLYLILENTTCGQAFVDEISIREVAGGAPVGPEVLRKNRFAYHLYFDQQPSWQWDHLFAEAERYGVTIRPVVLEKNDWIANHIDWDPHNIHRHNLYDHFKTFRDFMDGIPLNNGRYADARALTSHPDLRALGQMDRVARRGHLWLHHRQHTWRNSIDNVSPTPISGSVTIPNMAAGVYRVTWWDTWQGAPMLTQTVAASGVIWLFRSTVLWRAT